MMFRWTSGIAVSTLIASPGLAVAQDSEAMIVGNFSESGSAFYQLVYTHDISDSGFALRLDLARGSYDTFYDRTDGTAENERARFILRYAFDVAPTAVVTLSGGVSYNATSVSPNTANSPDDTSEIGTFAAIDLYWLDDWDNTLFATAEIDSVDADYYSARYLVNFGGFFLGPTANYIIEGDYSRRALGASVEVPFASGNGAVLATFATTEAEFGGGRSEDANYFELAFRMGF